jgi:cell division protease FtsH
LQIVLSAPDVVGREKILKIHFKNREVDESVDFVRLAKETSGLTGADLENIANRAAKLSVRRGKEKIDIGDIEDAKDAVLMGGDVQKKALGEQIKQVVAYHEAGHALAAYILRQIDPKNSDPLTKVSIIPRGMALGVTVQMPEEDQLLFSKKYLFNRIRILLGGRLAEEMLCGPMGITTGASNDLERATELVRKMVCRFGMSDKLGSRTFGRNTDHPFLGKDIFNDERNYSNETAKLIDEEVKDIFEKCRARTNKIISVNRAALDEIAKKLLEKETLGAEEIDALVKSAVPEENLRDKELYKS